MKVLVVGGGIAGLTLAIALRRRGIDVDVVEIQPEWDILGVGLSLTGPTLRALKSVDLIDACIAQAFGFDRITFGALQVLRDLGVFQKTAVVFMRRVRRDSGLARFPVLRVSLVL